MGRRVLALIRAVRRFNTLMHFMSGAALLVMLGLTVADITGRSAFNDPVRGTVELTQMLLVIVVFLALAHSEDLGDHITVDLLYARAGPRLKRFLEVVSDVLSVGVLLLLSYQLLQFTLRQRRSGAETPVIEVDQWPFVLIAALGALGYALATAFKLVLRSLGEPTEAEETRSIEGVSGVEV